MPQGPSNERGLLEAAERDRGKKEKKRRSSSVCSPSSEKIEGEPCSFLSLSLSFPPFSRGTTRVSRSFLPTCAISPFEQIRIPGSKPKVFSPSTLTDIYVYNF